MLADGVQRKKPETAFVVRLVGRGIRPWGVPMRKLATVLQAVQRLVEQNDESDAEYNEEVAEVQPDPSRILHLIDIKSSSAAYAVAAPDPQVALRVLSDVGSALQKPGDVDWPESTISSVEDFSEVARSLGCEIEFRQPGEGRRYGNILAKITPITYDEIKGSAYIQGRTSVYAKIERVGGATEMACGIRLPAAPRKMVICRVASEELTRSLGRFMYQHVILTGDAKWLRYDWRLKRMTIDAFDPPKTGSLVAALRKAHEAGGHAWDAIDDPNLFLAEMRGE